jgi:ribosome-binding factor A
MPNFRKKRVEELVREVISDLILKSVKDPRVQGVTITEVRMASDLKSANVYFSALADGRSETHLKGLQAAEGFIRMRLKKELTLKYIPTLTFHYDTAFDNFARIDSILKEIKPGEEDDVE